MAEAAITYPIESAKTRAQLQRNRYRNVLVSSVHPGLRQATDDCISTMYTGLTSVVAGAALKTGLRYLVYDGVTHRINEDKNKLSTMQHAAAGVVAGVAESVIVVTPSERIKTAMIDDCKNDRRFKSTSHALRLLWREGGPSSIYRGLITTTSRQAMSGAIKMGSYHAMAKSYGDMRGASSKSAPESFLIGAAAGAITVCTTQPLDVVKTRRQSAKGETISQAVRSILQSHGLSGFWGGGGLRLGRMSISSGIVLSIHEEILSLAQDLKRA